MPRPAAVSGNGHPLQLCMILLRTISHRLAGAVKRSVEQICKIYSNAVRASSLPLEPQGAAWNDAEPAPSLNAVCFEIVMIDRQNQLRWASAMQPSIAWRC